jgi:hypothetical protein
MDDKINNLIFGASLIAYTFEGGTQEYWFFPKSHIEQNLILLNFISDNSGLKVDDVYRKSLGLDPLEVLNNSSLLFKENEDHFLIHDSVRNMIYNFCISKLENHLALFKSNVMNEGLRELITDTKYFYSYNAMYEVENRLFSGLGHTQSVKNIVKGNIRIRRTVGNGIVLDINGLNELISYMKDNFNFTFIKFKN